MPRGRGPRPEAPATLIERRIGIRHGAPVELYTYEELLACGRGELFGPGNAQLPLPPMLMFDRITSIGEDGGANGKGHVRAELDVRPDLWFFPCHFKGDPVMPGCLGVDALWQLVGFYLGWLGSPGRGPGARRRRGEVHRPGPADRQEGGLRRSTSSGSSARSSCSASPTAGSRPTDAASTRPRTCGSACSRPSPRRAAERPRQGVGKPGGRESGRPLPVEPRRTGDIKSAKVENAPARPQIRCRPDLLPRDGIRPRTRHTIVLKRFQS